MGRFGDIVDEASVCPAKASCPRGTNCTLTKQEACAYLSNGLANTCCVCRVVRHNVCKKTWSCWKRPASKWSQ